MITDSPTYDPVAVQPLRNELIHVGFNDLFTPEEVDQSIQGAGTTLLVLNSVCGCSAGSVRPGVGAALQYCKIPDRLVALFAGQEKTAVAHLRTKYLGSSPPSSPNILLYHNQKLVLQLQRQDIQQMTAEEIARELVDCFDKLCTRKGPSIPREQFDQLEHITSCGSTMPRFDGKPGSC